MKFPAQEAAKVEKYLQDKLGNKQLTLRARDKVEDSVEVLLAGEFLGTVYRDADDGDVSYDFNMAILEMDLQD